MAESIAQAWESSALIALSSGVVTALSDRNRSGGRFPARGLLASILPGFRLLDAGEMPSSREGDRYFEAAPPSAAKTAFPPFLPVQCSCNQLALLVHHAQFTKRRIRTFITIPSARNMNNTEDPP